MAGASTRSVGRASSAREPPGVRARARVAISASRMSGFSGKMEAAVHVQIGSGHEAGVLRGEEGQGRRHLFGAAFAAQRRPGGDGLAGLRLGEDVMEAGADQAGTEAVDAYAMRSELLGERSRQGHERALGG